MQIHVQHTLIILQHELDNLKREIPQIMQNIINKKLQYLSALKLFKLFY